MVFNASYDPDLVPAMMKGRKKLKKYYSLTDDNPAYILSTILSPTFKINYFTNNDWEEEAIALIQKKHGFKIIIFTNINIVLG